jgi:hypothetical protein
VVWIGNRAGPALALSNLVHELCHFVEIDDARMTVHGWGLHVPQVVILGQVCNEPVTKKMTERELRVIAYQLNVLESIGAPSRAKNLVSSLQYMSDFIYVPLEDGRSAYGEDSPDREEMSSREKDASRIRWMANKVTELRAQYTLERFDREFFRKAQLLSVNFGAPPSV